MSKLLTSLTLGLSTLFSTSAMAQVDMQVLNDFSQPMPQYQHPYSGQSWLLAEEGQRYRLRLTNYSTHRVLVVVSVDGLNVVTGQSANPHQSGYVLEPGQTSDISGWRKSDRNVARFYFTFPEDSYGARTGRPNDLGVIGAVVFRERYQPPVMILPSPRPGSPRDWAKTQESPEAGAAPSASSMDSVPSEKSLRNTQSLGTGHGEREWSQVRRTTFEREPYPIQQIEYRYGTYGQLIEEGVIAPRTRTPRAFPGAYVPDPPQRW